jgi:glycerol-3-phosphate dehydrogenase (NAD(P)+)
MGAGSWGTAFSMVLADAGCDVAIWSHHADQAEAINQERINSAFFPDLVLPHSIRAYADARQAMEGARFVVLAIPSQALRENLARWEIPADAALVSLAKGIELGTVLRMSQLIGEVTKIPSDRIAVVSGPNLAREVAERQPAATVVACTSEETATALQAACHTARFRAYTNTDVIGVELGGATKNVIALAVGMAVGFGLGDNSTASVITRGLAETIRLGAVLGAQPYTFSGLAGLGDLVATCSSPLSRNRTFGEGLGRGRTVAEIAASTRQVAEGVKSCSSIRQLARDNGVEMPIVEAVDAVIAGTLTPRDMIDSLMSRAAKPERY